MIIINSKQATLNTSYRAKISLSKILYKNLNIYTSLGHKWPKTDSSTSSVIGGNLIMCLVDSVTGKYLTSIHL